jgi:hypothetical protein
MVCDQLDFEINGKMDFLLHMALSRTGRRCDPGGRRFSSKSSKATLDIGDWTEGRSTLAVYLTSQESLLLG